MTHPRSVWRHAVAFESHLRSFLPNAVVDKLLTWGLHAPRPTSFRINALRASQYKLGPGEEIPNAVSNEVQQLSSNEQNSCGQQGHARNAVHMGARGALVHELADSWRDSADDGLPIQLPWYRDGYVMPYTVQGGQQRLTQPAPVSTGAVYVQSVASQLPALCLGVKPGMKVLDLCAAPGGKTTQLAASMQLQGLLLANEVDRFRLQRLQHNIALLLGDGAGAAAAEAGGGSTSSSRGGSRRAGSSSSGNSTSIGSGGAQRGSASGTSDSISGGGSSASRGAASESAAASGSHQHPKPPKRVRSQSPPPEAVPYGMYQDIHGSHQRYFLTLTRQDGRHLRVEEKTGMPLPEGMAGPTGAIPGRSRGAFDRILLDAPCSGSGRINMQWPSTHESWKPTEEFMKVHVQRQKQLLLNAFKMLKPGGYLLYSTCSLSPEENEDVVQWMLHTVRECQLEPITLDDLTIGQSEQSSDQHVVTSALSAAAAAAAGGGGGPKQGAKAVVAPKQLLLRDVLAQYAPRIEAQLRAAARGREQLTTSKRPAAAGSSSGKSDSSTREGETGHTSSANGSSTTFVGSFAGPRAEAESSTCAGSSEACDDDLGYIVMGGLQQYKGKPYSHDIPQKCVRLLPCLLFEGFFLAKMKKRKV